MRTDRRWTVGGALGAVVLLALSWFLLISPEYDETARLNTEATAAEDRLAGLQRKLVELRRQDEKRDQYREQLVRDRHALPTTAALADFLRELEDAGTRTGVSVSGLVVGSPTPVVGVAPPVFSLPITMIAVGTSPKLTQFLDQLQKEQPRAVLISSINAVPDGLSRSLAERVALTLSMQAFLAPPGGAGAPTAIPAGAPTAVPTG